MSLIFMFPGQSSIYPEMLERTLASWSWASAVVRYAEKVLDRDLLRHYRSENPEIFKNNEDVQIGCFLTSYLYLLALTRAGIETDTSLGLSLGEYNHLVHIGALSFEEALALVAARGRAYDAGPQGKLASVFPIAVECLEALLSEARSYGFVEIASYNSPRQHVIGGEAAAVDVVLKRIEEEIGLEPVVIERRLPIHTSCFEPVARAFLPALQCAAWKIPYRSYLPNVSAVEEKTPEPARFIELLASHVHRPVLWRKSIERLWEQQPESVFVEVGPRSVLFNLLSRSWIPCRRAKTDGSTNFDALVEQLAARV